VAVKELFTNEFTGKAATRPIEYRFLTQDGSWRYLESVCRNLSRNLAVGGLVITSRDITERKKLEAHFLRAQRMESIGTLAGGIAHDLNNVLTPILMSLKLLRDLKEQAPPDLLDTLEASAHRGAAIVQQVLSFARGVEGEKGILQLKHPLNEVLKIARDVFPPGVQIRSTIPANLAPINGDPTQLHQVFMNLLVNARDAMSSGGEIRVEAQNVVLDENYARMQPESKPGAYVLVNVSDQGTGISPEIVNKIFEPFFTTKEIGKGTGLGLSTALGIVRSHGGFLSVYSEPRKGSTFKVYLPAADGDTAGKQGEKQLPQVLSGQGEWVLVVDDEAAVREIIKVTLENNGYHVVTATDGAEAIARLASKVWKIGIVILDMMMPYMDGLSTMRALKRLDPDLKFIAISGLMDQPRTSQLSELGQVEFLAKPFTTEQLLRVLKPDDSETS
jgi:signal transduction histidine kinase/CheY-like chemotaxis protein